MINVCYLLYLLVVYHIEIVVQHISEAYLEPSPKSRMKVFAEIVNYFRKKFHFWLGSEYASVFSPVFSKISVKEKIIQNTLKKTGKYSEKTRKKTDSAKKT